MSTPSAWPWRIYGARTPTCPIRRRNLDRHLAFIERAAAKGAEFVGFPELSINGYRFSKDMLWLSLDGPELGALAGLAPGHKTAGPFYGLFAF